MCVCVLTKTKHVTQQIKTNAGRKTQQQNYRTNHELCFTRWAATKPRTKGKLTSNILKLTVLVPPRLYCAHFTKSMKPT